MRFDTWVDFVRYTFDPDKVTSREMRLDTTNVVTHSDLHDDFEQNKNGPVLVTMSEVVLPGDEFECMEVDGFGNVSVWTRRYTWILFRQHGMERLLALNRNPPKLSEYKGWSGWSELPEKQVQNVPREPNAFLSPKQHLYNGICSIAAQSVRSDMVMIKYGRWLPLKRSRKFNTTYCLSEILCQIPQTMYLPDFHQRDIEFLNLYARNFLQQGNPNDANYQSLQGLFAQLMEQMPPDRKRYIQQELIELLERKPTNKP